GPGQLRPRSRPRRPSPPPSFYDGPLLVLPRGDLRLVSLGGLTGWNLHVPADAVQQQVQPGQGVLDTEAAAHDFGDPRHRPPPVPPSGGPRAGRPPSLEEGGVAWRGACNGRPGAPGSPGPAAPPKPTPAASDSPTSASL